MIPKMQKINFVSNEHHGSQDPPQRTRKASEKRNNRLIQRNRSNDGDFHPEKLKLVECNNQLVNGEGR